MHPEKRENKMSALFKHIWLVFLCLCMLIFTVQETEETGPQNVEPQNECSDCIRAEQSAIDKTIAHLYAERLPVPVQAIAKPFTHSEKSNKYKGVYHLISSICTDIQTGSIRFLSPPNRLEFHTIDYYIYTLEHILI